MILECREAGNFIPHPEGIYPAVCVDVVDLGLELSDYKGQRRMVNKVKLVFETGTRGEDGTVLTVSKTFTASLGPTAKLAEFLGKWRGRPVVLGEKVDLEKVMGASCTLVISHQRNLVGKIYASIDAVSKPTRAVAPSGTYDGVAMRKRLAEWKAKQVAGGSSQLSVISSQPPVGSGQASGAARPPQSIAPAAQAAGGGRQANPFPPGGGGTAASTGAPAPGASAGGSMAYDPEVGF